MVLIASVPDGRGPNVFTKVKVLFVFFLHVGNFVTSVALKNMQITSGGTNTVLVPFFNVEFPVVPLMQSTFQKFKTNFLRCIGCLSSFTKDL